MISPEDRSAVRYVPGLFDPVLLRQVIAHFDAVEADRQAAISSPRDAARVAIGAATDALRFDPLWYEPWRRMPAERTASLAPWAWLLFPVQVRTLQDDPGHLVPWHQDIAYVRQMARPHRRVITVFVPLEPEPHRHATLEFANGRFPALRHEVQGGHGAAIVDEDFPDTVAYRLALGDALVFGDHAPHRTVVPEGGTIRRRSFEYRLVIPDEALDDKDYFDIRDGAWVRSDGQRSDRHPGPGPA